MFEDINDKPNNQIVASEAPYVPYVATEIDALAPPHFEGLTYVSDDSVKSVGRNLFEDCLVSDGGWCLDKNSGEMLQQIVTNGSLSGSQEFWNHLNSTEIEFTYELESTPTGEKIKGEIKMERIEVVESFYKAKKDLLQEDYDKTRKALIEESPSFKTAKLLNSGIASELNKLFAEEIEAGTMLKVDVVEHFVVSGMYTAKLKTSLSDLQKILLDSKQSVDAEKMALYERLALCNDKQTDNTVIDVLKVYKIITI